MLKKLVKNLTLIKMFKKNKVAKIVVLVLVTLFLIRSIYVIGYHNGWDDSFRFKEEMDCWSYKYDPVGTVPVNCLKYVE